MSRLLDLVAVAALAVVLLLPKASVDARPALEGAEPVELDRIAKLQDDAFGRPDDVGPALDLADAFLSFFRADWAIASLQPFVDREREAGGAGDARVHLLLATARAERLEAADAVAEAHAAEEACARGEGTAGCPSGTTGRARVIRDAMQVLLDQRIDPAKDPQRAKDAVYKALHPSHSNFAPRPPAAPAPPKR